MTPTPTKLCRLAGVALAFALSSTPALADASRDRAVRLAKEGRCAAALPELDSARVAAPEDALLARLSGECRMRLHRYPEAVRDLEEAVRLDPQPRHQLALAKAAYHARELATARTALDAASADLSQDAEFWLYRGMLQIEDGDDEAAITSLERARSLDAERVEPVASYHLGLARGRTQDTDAAERELTRVVDAWRGTDWSTRADQERARLRESGARYAWIGAGAGFEWDDNVVLRGRGLPRPVDIGKKDVRGVWTGTLGSELWKSDDLTVGVMGHYRGTTHEDQSAFDAHFPSGTAWIDLSLSEIWLANLRYDFGYAWLNGDPFLSSSHWQLTFLRDGALGTSELWARFHMDDYFFTSDDVPDADAMGGCAFTTCSPVGINEPSARRRSGYGVFGGVGHRLPIDTGSLPVRDVALRGAYEYGEFEARGREYSFRHHLFRLDLSAELPLEVGLDVSGAFAYRPFRHPSTFPDPPTPVGAPYRLRQRDRLEKAYEVETRLRRKLTDIVSVSAHWRYVDNQSNVRVFDYEQHVLGASIDFVLGREL